MGIQWADPAHRAAVKSCALYATIFTIAALGVAGLASSAWTIEDAAWRRVPCCLAIGTGTAGLWFVALDRVIQDHVCEYTGLRPSDALEVLYRAHFKGE